MTRRLPDHPPPPVRGLNTTVADYIQVAQTSYKEDASASAMTDHSGDFEDFEDEKVAEKSEVDEEEADEEESDEEEEEEEGSGEKTAAELRIAYSKLNKLLTVANQGRHHESILKSITDNKRGEWEGASHDAGVLEVPLNVLGLGGGRATFSISTKKRPREEEAAPDKTLPSDTQKALKVFQSSSVKTALRALLADTLGAANEAVCAAVEARERAAAQTKLDAAVALLNEKRTDARAKAVEKAQERQREVAKRPFAMPADDAPPGDAEKAVSKVLSQLQGGLWTLAKETLSKDELARVAGAEDPAALVQEPWFREAFKAAAKTELPSEAPKMCKGCKTTGCLMCRRGVP